MAKSPTTFKSKYLALKLEQSGAVKAEGPGGLVLNTDVETVKKAALVVSTEASAAVAVAGLENCLKVGLAGTAIAVAAGAIYKKWPWMKTVNVKENNVLEIQVAGAKEDAFDALVERDKIRAHLEDSFEDLDSNLDGILGDEVCNLVGQEIIKQLEGVQIYSANVFESEVIGHYLRSGKHRTTQVISTGKKRKHAVGFLAENSDVEIHGGVEMVGDIGSEDIAAVERLRRVMCLGNMITVNVNGDDIEEPFKEKFEESDLVNNILLALKEREQKNFTLWKRGDILLDRTLSLYEAGVTHNSSLIAKVAK